LGAVACAEMPGPGASIGRYVIEAVIGEGGMGRVYRALDPRLGRRVALKLLLAEGSEKVPASAAARMMREARAAAAFSHPNVVAIHDVGDVSGNPYIAMELVSGRTLRELAREALTPESKRISWLLDVARGLAAAHRAGLVHRDIKPDNVMVTTDGVVKILDFGIARRADTEPSELDVHSPTTPADLSSLTAEGQIIGTPQYMAPEQLRGEPLDGRCDQFAWGVMAWELLAGKSPWGQPTNPAVLMTAVLASEPPALRELVPSVPLGVSDAILRALSKSRSARFGTMDELVAAIEAEGTQGAAYAPTAEGPAVSPSEAGAPSTRHRAGLARAETVFWLAIGLLAVFGIGYAHGLRGLALPHEGGILIWALLLLYAIGAAFLVRGSPVHWLPVATCVVGIFATYVGAQHVLDYLAANMSAAAAQRFRILHEGMFEANVCRFVGFGLATTLAVASLRLLPRAQTREQALRKCGALAFAYGCAALALLTRFRAVASSAWSSAESSRGERVARVVAASRAHDGATLALLAGALGLVVLAVAWVRRLPGQITLRGLLGGNTAVAIVVVVGVLVDGLLSFRLHTGVSDIYAEIGPQLELFGNLDPATTSRSLPAPPSAPTLKLSRERVAVDSVPAGLVSALDQGNLDTVLLTDLSRRLAASTTPVDPPLLVMADRATTSTTLLAGLHIALEAGVTRVGILFARGASPVLQEGDPPEAAYAVPSDFGMTIVTLAYCPAVASDWTALAPGATVCVGARPARSGDSAPPPQ
jgi:hypothetical protein